MVNLDTGESRPTGDTGVEDAEIARWEKFFRKLLDSRHG